MFFHGAGGVLLPLSAFLVEAATGICRDAFFDPIPTVWFAMLVLFVPLANAGALFLCRGERFERAASGIARWMLRANACAIGVAAGYALAFLPFTPFALVGLLFFGLGLLPLAPLLSLVSALLLRRALSRARPGGGQTPASTGWPVLIGVIAVSGALVPDLLTDWAVNRLARDPEAPVALAWLRHVADDEHLLENARSLGFRSQGWLWIKPAASAYDYQVAYYRATGGNPQTAAASRGLFFDSTARDWNWDFSEGEQQVGARLEHLKLIDSRLEATADSVTAIGYTEWTMTFANAHQFQPAEARALIQVPAGGVVSRLTLWIDGEEREAAFGGRSEVTQAYKAVVNQRRDPVLVTHKGADRVLMQCFPVPAAHGEMKVRLGITYPLLLSASSGRVIWPRLLEQNFNTAKNFRHTLWSAEADRGRPPAGLSLITPVNNGNFRAGLKAEELTAGQGTFEVPCEGGGPVYGVVPDGTQRRVRQTFAFRPGADKGLAIVLDGSAGMAETGRALAAALAQLPSGIRVDLWLSGDRLHHAPAETGEAVARWLRNQTFRGGQDNTDALIAAHDAVLGRPQGSVLWIHGPQPYAWTDSSGLVQRFARNGGAVTLHDYSTGWSENARLTELSAVVSPRRIDPVGTGTDEMTRVLRQVIEPSRIAVRELDPSIATEGDSRQLGRLWASEEVERLMRGDRPRRQEAVELARKSQLVTSVTGAVVLETRAQYDAAGLKPVDPASTPSIPEPATVALVGGALALAFALRGRRAFRTRQPVAKT